MNKNQNMNKLAGKTLRKLREDKGFTQQQLAELLDVSRVSICNIERGIHSLTITHLYLLCCILGTTPETFLPKIKHVKIETKVVKVKVIKIKKSLKLRPLAIEKN